MDILQFISVMGLGAILATLLQVVLTNRMTIKSRNFEEKKKAYVGFLEAMYQSEINPSAESSLYGGYWANICKIVGSEEVQKLLEEHRRTNPVNGIVHPSRPEVLQNLYKAMRKDLGF